MDSLEEFIVSYPTLDNDAYSDEMGSMREFRDMLYRRGPDGEYVNVANMDNEDDPFFRNYQMLIGRWLAPWTNNRTMLIRWDPGVGKTRAALSFASMWMRHSSHNKALLLSDQEIVHRALDDEVARYNRFDVELAEATYAMGRRAHGRLISTTTRLRKHGFEKGVIVRFLNNEIKAALDTSGYMIKDARNRDTPDFRVIIEDRDNVKVLTAHLRKKYANYVIIVDEVHSMKYGKGKQSYDYLMIVLDALRDICPILFLTATPIENSWKDAFSVVSMMHGPRVRASMLERISSLPDAPLDPSIIWPVLDMLRNLASGRVSYRDSGGVVPDKVYVAPPGMVDSGVYHVARGSDEPEEVGLEFMYPVFMGLYQSSRLEDKDRVQVITNMDTGAIESIQDTKNDIYSTSRLMYDVVGPETGDGGYIQPETLVIDEDGVYTPSIDATIQWEGMEPENVFKVSYLPDGTIDTTHGLGRFSIKYATMIDLLNQEDGPFTNMAGYVHTLWVQRGIKVMAAALAANGWDQYTGTENITRAGERPRFACIHGGTTSSDVGRIIEIFNSPTNRDGSILRLILGSKKSGISISFINARFFIEMSSDFNKSKNIQSQGRVLRANALMWAREVGVPRDVIIMNMIALPVGSDQLESVRDGYITSEYYSYDTEEGVVVTDDELVEMAMGADPGLTLEEAAVMVEEGDIYDLFPEIRRFDPFTVEVWMYWLSEVKYRTGAEVMDVLRACSIETIIEERLDLEANTKNDALLYGTITRHDIKREMLSAITTDWAVPVDRKDMYDMRSVAELISSNTLIMNRYGFPRPVQSYGSSVSAFMATGCHASQCALNITYDRNFFVTSATQRMDPSVLARAIDAVIGAPLDEYEFIRYIAMINSTSLKITIMETTLSKPTSLSGNRLYEFNRNRDHILKMYDLYWDTYTGGRLMHILWYGLAQTHRSLRPGIVVHPESKTRELTYDTRSNASIGGWRYIMDLATESMYLTQMADRIAEKERVVAEGAMDIGFYMQMSIVDGMIRSKRVSMEGEPMSVDLITSNSGVPHVATLLGLTEEEVRSRISNDLDRLRRDTYYAAKERGVLIIK